MDQTYDSYEQVEVNRIFAQLLWNATKDGGRKRAAGEKPPWYVDAAHEAAIFSHLNKWKHGEYRDPDSGVHPLVHLAWRALAIAYQETYGYQEPGPLILDDLGLTTWMEAEVGRNGPREELVASPAPGHDHADGCHNRAACRRLGD